MDFFANHNIQLYILAYLIGSIPFGLILAKVFAKVNIKEQGSKSIGATNVLRVVKQSNPALAKKLGLATIILDALKALGLIAVARIYGVDMSVLWGLGVLSVLGHCYSIYLGLEGGKGVATGFGVFLILIPIPALIALIIWGLCAKFLKVSSLSSLIALIALFVAVFIFNNGLGVDSNAPLYIIAVIVVYKHIPNILRLFKGKEKKVSA